MVEGWYILIYIQSEETSPLKKAYRWPWADPSMIAARRGMAGVSLPWPWMITSSPSSPVQQLNNCWSSTCELWAHQPVDTRSGRSPWFCTTLESSRWMSLLFVSPSHPTPWIQQQGKRDEWCWCSSFISWSSRGQGVSTTDTHPLFLATEFSGSRGGGWGSRTRGGVHLLASRAVWKQRFQPGSVPISWWSQSSWFIRRSSRSWADMPVSSESLLHKCHTAIGECDCISVALTPRSSPAKNPPLQITLTPSPIKLQSRIDSYASFLPWVNFKYIYWVICT